MADYSLGTAEGTVVVKYDGSGIRQANRGMDDLESRAKRVQGSFQDVARTSGIAAAALAAGIGFAVNAAIDFEQRLSAISAVSGATEAELESLRAKALQLGADTAFSASEAASAMEELVKAGLSVEDVLNGAADATVNLAAAGEIELAEAATIASNAMNQFGLAAEDLPRIADLIAGAANASAIDISQFGFSLSQAGAVANLVGVSFDDLATAIALMGNQGIVGSDAGTSLKTALQNLQPTTAKQTELMRELGLITEDGANQFFNAEGQLKSLSEVAGILQGSLEGLTDAERTMALETIFGSDAIRAAAVLADEGAAGFEAMAAAMGEVSAQEVAEERLNNVAGAMEQLKGSIETAAILFGTALLPVIKTVTEFITELVNKFSALDPKWQKLIAFGAVAATVLLGVVTALAALGAIIAGVTAAFSAGLGPVLAIIIGVIAVVAALAAGIKYLWDNSEGFRGAVLALWDAAKQAFNGLVETLRPVVEWFRDRVIPVVKDTAREFLERLEPAFKAVSEFITNKFMPAWQKIQEELRKIMPTLIEIGEVLLTGLSIAWKALGAAIGFVLPIVMKIAGVLIDILGPVIGWLIQQIPKVWAAIQFGAGVIGAIIGVIMTLADIVGDAFAIIKAIVTVVMETIAAFIRQKWDQIKAIWEAIDQFIIPPVEYAWNFIKGIIETVMNFIRTHVTERWDQVKAIFQAAIDRIVGIADRIREFIDKVRRFFGEMADAARGGTDEFLEFVRGIPGRVVSAIGNLAGLLYQKGRDVIQGLINGIKSMIGNIGSAMSGIVGEITSWLPGSPAKKGPLSGRGYVLYRGEHLTEDFAAGIANQAVEAEQAVAAAMKGISRRIPTEVTAALNVNQAAGEPAPVPVPAGNTEININVPLEDLRSIENVKDLLDFIDRLRNNSRRGLVTV